MVTMNKMGDYIPPTFLCRLEKFHENCDQLVERRRQFAAALRKDIDDAIRRYPLVVKEQKRKVDLDAETPGTEALPPPLIPIAASTQAPPVQSLTGVSADNQGSPPVDLL